MARSLDIDALTEDELRQLLEEILNRLPAQELLLVRDIAEAKRREKLEDAKQAVLKEMRGKLEGLGLTLDDVIPLRTKKREARRSKQDGSRVLPVKYRGTHGEAWSGRGHVPQWLKALEEAGHNRDEFLVTPEEQ